jgi:hypothetical protein
MTELLAASPDHGDRAWHDHSCVEHSFAGEQALQRGLAGYLAAIGTALGVGLESCTIDAYSPASAYLALDWQQRRCPGVELALLWDEQCGWAAALEGEAAEDFTILGYLGGDVLPEPEVVARFAAAAQHGTLPQRTDSAREHATGQRPGAPPLPRSELVRRLARYALLV